MRLDHVTVAGSSLPRLREAFAAVGLETDYGGPHSNGATHMALLGFDDGSYVELISLVDGARESPLWHRQISDDGGPAAWAVVENDLGGEVERLRALGVPVRGPVDYHRARPDGAAVEWELAFPGTEPPGAVLPFLISDRTPRERRVSPSASVAGSEIEGVDAVVLAVRDARATMDIFRRCYGWSEAVEMDAPDFGARLAQVPGTPVVLAQPLSGNGGLSRRIVRFGESPCAFLLRSRDLAATSRRLGVPAGSPLEKWFGRPLLWMPSCDPATPPPSFAHPPIGFIG